MDRIIPDMERDMTGEAQAQSETANAFTKFSGLPFELRLSIWELSAPPPQVITIKVPEESPTKFPLDLGATASYKIPSMLHTNQESRAVGKKIYSREYADRLGGIGVWTDKTTDIIYFEHWEGCVLFFGGQVKTVNPMGRRGLSFRKPLYQHLPALAYNSWYSQSQRFFLPPEALATMGKPRTLYQLRERTTRVTIEHVRSAQNFINRHWRKNAAWVKIVKYEKPVVVGNTLKGLKAQLADSRPPLPKIKRPTSNLGKTFLKAASFQPMT